LRLGVAGIGVIADDAASMTERIVFITGAGSGIGRACAELMRERGVGVIAGVRDEAERVAVQERGDDVEASVVFDVRDARAVERGAAETLERIAGRALVGVVNSAGIVVAGPLELLPDEDLRRQFDVNVFGLMNVTRAFLPRLRDDGGRVVNIGSVAGRLSVPFTGAYSASKFAVRSLSDALRLELAGAGVHVALVEPGPIATPIWRTSLEAGQQLEDRLGEQVERLYGPEIDRVRALTKKTEEHAIPARRVADVVAHALLDRRPRAHYLVGASALGQAAVSELPSPLRDALLRRILGLTRRPDPRRRPD
jgi:NAD(P)-dependent dehydrogenase (short-subunit alcohol dehydrogenase family)